MCIRDLQRQGTRIFFFKVLIFHFSQCIVLKGKLKHIGLLCTCFGVCNLTILNSVFCREVCQYICNVQDTCLHLWEQWIFLPSLSLVLLTPLSWPQLLFCILFLFPIISMLIISILHYSNSSRGDYLAEISIAPIVPKPLCKVSSAYGLAALGPHVHLCLSSSHASPF